MKKFNRAYKDCFHPTDEQKELFAKTFGRARIIRVTLRSLYLLAIVFGI